MTKRATHDHAVSPAVQALRDKAQQVRLVECAGGVLYWDDRLTRPRVAAAWRAHQRAQHAAYLHDVATSDRLHAAIARVEDEDADHREARAMRRAFDQRHRVPRAMWADREACASTAFTAWEAARKAGNAAEYLPALQQMVDAIRRQAEAAGYSNEPYEACLAEWEPGIDVATVDRCFAELRHGMAPLLRGITPDVEMMQRPLSPRAMQTIEQRVVDAVGFDSTRGLLQPSERAFCLVLGPDDVRMTSRFQTTPGIRGIHSTLHEAGHAVYAQAFERLGVPATLAVAPGLGLDESQSRLVENAIGRGPAFTTWLFRQLRELAPESFPNDDEFDRFCFEVSLGESPLRRLGADEASYDLHIAVRYDLERALVNGALHTRDLPEAWAAAYEDVLGVRPTNDLDGCLQDVHWSLGQWGYFPTYTLGNVYGAQLLEHARDALQGLDADLARAGDTQRLRDWMDEHIYRHGSADYGRDLVERVTGRTLDPSALVRAVTARRPDAARGLTTG